jgi:hypothetical protein
MDEIVPVETDSQPHAFPDGDPSELAGIDQDSVASRDLCADQDRDAQTLAGSALVGSGWA